MSADSTTAFTTALLNNPGEIISSSFDEIGVDREKTVEKLMNRINRNNHIEFIPSDPIFIDFSEKGTTVFVAIDGPNSWGVSYQHPLDIEKVKNYAYQLDNTAKMYYLTKIDHVPSHIEKRNPRVFNKKRMGRNKL